MQENLAAVGTIAVNLSLSTIPYSPQRGPAAKIKPAPRSQIRARILSTTHHNTAMNYLEITRVRKHGLQ